MLYLTRKKGQSVIIDNKIEIIVKEIKGGNVKLGFQLPKEISILRKELLDNIKKQNRNAVTISQDDIQDLI